MTNKIKSLLVASALVAGAQQASAIPIVGGLGFSGLYTPNVSNLSLATTLTIGSTTVSTVSGDFTPPVIVGSVVTVGSPIILPAGIVASGTPIAIPPPPIWSVLGFTLTLTPGMFFQLSDFPTSVTLYGEGTLDDGAGPYDPTPGDVTLTFARAGSVTFTYASTSSAFAVPDGGATAMLMGLGFLGAAALRRKQS